MYKNKGYAASDRTRKKLFDLKTGFIFSSSKNFKTLLFYNKFPLVTKNARNQRFLVNHLTTRICMCALH